MCIWYKPNCIWNIDECAVQDVPKQEEVIGVVNEPALQLVSGGKGQTTTNNNPDLCQCKWPQTPMIIFKGAKALKEWWEAAPVAVYVRASLSGYMNAKLFSELW